MRRIVIQTMSFFGEWRGKTLLPFYRVP